MTKISTKFTEGQIKRLKNCIRRKAWIHKDLRKKLYHCVKLNLKIKDGIVNTLFNEVHKLVAFDFDVMICFPSDEISLDSYWKFIGEEPDHDYDENKFDEFDVQGYKNRILFLQYLIDKM